MTLYEYLFKVVSNLTSSKEKCFNFNEVVDYLGKIEVSKEENYKDILFKIKKAEDRYLTLFEKDLSKSEEIKKLKEKVATLKAIPPSFIFRVKRKLRKIFGKKK